MTGWERALSRMSEGDTIDGSKAVYKLLAIEEKRLVWTRVGGVRRAEGTALKARRENVAATLLNRVWEATADGGTLTKHASGPKGGISYTSLVELAVVASLGLRLNDERRWTR